MIERYIPDFIGKSEKAVVMLVSDLDDKLNNILKRFHAGEQVAYQFEWYIDQDENNNYKIMFYMEFDSGEEFYIELDPYHWDCLPNVVNLGYIVLMTDQRLLGDQDGIAAEESGEPRALLIHNAFKGIDRVVEQAARKVRSGESEDLKVILNLFEISPEQDGMQRH